jgi:hypothetical protein
MSDIPTQSSSRGAHEAEDEYSYDPSSYEAAPYDAASYETAPLGSDADDEAPAADDTASFEPLAAHSDVDLDSDPFADDLSKELAHAAPKTWFNRTSIVIGGLVLIVGGFLGGIQVQKHYGSSSSANSAANNIANLRAQFQRGGAGRTGGTGTGGFPGFGGGTGTGGTGTGTGAAAAAQTGTVKFVDGTTIYVTLANGNVLTVKTDGTTKVTTSTASKLSALKAGQTVTIGGGTPDATGNMTATSVTATK